MRSEAAHVVVAAASWGATPVAALGGSRLVSAIAPAVATLLLLPIPGRLLLLVAAVLPGRLLLLLIAAVLRGSSIAMLLLLVITSPGASTVAGGSRRRSSCRLLHCIRVLAHVALLDHGQQATPLLGPVLDRIGPGNLSLEPGLVVVGVLLGLNGCGGGVQMASVAAEQRRTGTAGQCRALSP